jgi:exopolysaccharide biosynthesis polyprenyl glycosylphosphotransferase
MRRLQIFLLWLADIAFFYLALFIALLAESRTEVLGSFQSHFLPFTIILLLWLLVFYIGELYDFRHFKNFVELSKIFFVVFLVCVGLAIGFFYLTADFFGIAPKTNLLLVIIIFGALGLAARLFASRNLAKYKTKAFFIKPEKEAANLIEYLKNNAQLGYEPVVITEISGLKADLADTIQERAITIILPAHLLASEEITKMIYENLGENIDVVINEELHETIFRKLPASELNEAWFLKNIARPKTYAKLKYFCEPFFAAIIFIILLPLLLLVAILVKLTSPGPIIYAQRRVGRGGKIFVLYKFRTMIKDAEREGPKWAATKDTRVTPVGRFLRHAHLDELPQLINIIKGELSFVGPRPERPEFVEELKRQIPFYNIRHLGKPGIAGWAQLNYKYGASVEDAARKLEYDLFYLKNNSLILDFVIILKTLKRFFVKAT